jgi:predicted class III extradiol MEMO1 family dioxygenase
MKSFKRKASHSGTWYPNNSNALNDLLRSFMQQESDFPKEKPDLLIVP